MCIRVVCPPSSTKGTVVVGTRPKGADLTLYNFIDETRGENASLYSPKDKSVRVLALGRRPLATRHSSYVDLPRSGNRSTVFRGRKETFWFGSKGVGSLLLSSLVYSKLTGLSIRS